MSGPSDRWVAPWTDEQANALNVMQKNERGHPYTCPGEMATCKGQRNLIATRDGWICRCGSYRQGWAHALHSPTTSVAPSLASETWTFNEDEMTVEAEGGVVVATVMGEDDFPCIEDEEREHVQADCLRAGRLIASAPDLLAALQWFVDDIDGSHTVMVDFDVNMERARAAIAASRGTS